MKLMTAAEGPNVTIARVRLKWIGTNFARESGERRELGRGRMFLVTSYCLLFVAHSAAVAVVTALLFGIVHAADRSQYLTLGTFFLALIWTPHYCKYGNVVPLGLYHGWIGKPPTASMVCVCVWCVSVVKTCIMCVCCVCVSNNFLLSDYFL